MARAAGSFWAMRGSYEEQEVARGGGSPRRAGGKQAGKQAGEEDRDPNEISKISGAYLKNIDNY